MTAVIWEVTTAPVLGQVNRPAPPVTRVATCVLHIGKLIKIPTAPLLFLISQPTADFAVSDSG